MRKSLIGRAVASSFGSAVIASVLLIEGVGSPGLVILGLVVLNFVVLLLVMAKMTHDKRGKKSNLIRPMLIYMTIATVITARSIIHGWTREDAVGLTIVTAVAAVYIFARYRKSQASPS